MDDELIVIDSQAPTWIALKQQDGEPHGRSVISLGGEKNERYDKYDTINREEITARLYHTHL